MLNSNQLHSFADNLWAQILVVAVAGTALIALAAHYIW
jgi:hypothetical protein